MSDEAPPSGACVINPWAKATSDITELRPWKEFVQQYELSEQQYSTPFCVFTDLLDRWTSSISSKTTPECSDDERLKRLFEVVGGYPRIANGYRPLDFPALPLAMPSLVLSLYLDSIPVETGPSWHSLRTYILIEDIKMKNQLGDINNNAENLLQSLTSTLIQTIRRHEAKFEPDSYLPKSLNQHERKFLAVLHSTEIDRVQLFWPKGKKGPSINTMQFEKSLFDLNYHEFKFETIQTWIRKWGHGFEITNIDQNYYIGPSVALEAIFCRLRSYILEEYGIGSICIDGGGRIAFLSVKSTEDVEAQAIKFVNESFIENRDTRIHRHPYHETIEKYMKIYIQKSEENTTTTWRNFEKHWQGLEIPNQSKEGAAISYFLSEENMKSPILPSISQSNFEIEYENKPKVKKCKHTEKMTSTDTAHKSQECKLCQGMPFEHGSQPKDENCHELCTMHWLLWGIAKDSKLRYSGLRTERGPNIGDEKFGKITDIIALDGNCLGSIFCDLFEWEFENTLHEKDPMNKKIDSDKLKSVWEMNKETYLSLRTKPSNTELDRLPHLLEQYELHNDRDIRRVREHIEERTRLKAILRRMRRSFDFNANWALSFHNSVLKKEKSLSPWIYAGDDIVLVNRSGMMDEEIVSSLNDFHDNLQHNLARCKISFAGGWVKRDQSNHPIRDTLTDSLTSEKVAKHTWKHEILPTKFAELLGKAQEDKRTGCETCASTGLNLSEDPHESCTSYRFEGRGQKPHSLLIRLNSDALSNLEKQEETEYKK